MDVIDLLRELVSINSVFPNESGIGEFAEERLRELGYSVQRQLVANGRFNVLAERGTQGRPILLYAHLDTVPVYGNWKSDPFILQEDGNRLHGLGVYDIKSGIASIIKACETRSERRVKVAFCVDEENDSAGAHALCNSDFVKDVEGVVATEILDVPNASSNCVMLGRRGRCVLQIEVPGRSAHGGHSSEGVNAINEAARLVGRLGAMELPSHPLLPKPNQFVRKIAAESTSLSVPDTAIVELDRHLVSPETPESARAEVQKFIDSLYDSGEFREIDGRRIVVRVKPREVPYLLPYTIPSSSDLANRVCGAVKGVTNSEPRFVYGASVADENIFAMHGLPVVTVGPVGGNQHQANEWIEKKSYLELIEVLKRIIEPGEE